MERRSFLAVLVALLLAPFIRFFDRFKPRPKLRGYSIELGKVPSFDPNEPFSASMWFKSKPSGDCRYLFESTSTGKISETTLLDDVTDDEGRTFSVKHLGSRAKDDIDIFIDGRRQGEPPLPPGTIVRWGSAEQPAKVAVNDVPGNNPLS